MMVSILRAISGRRELLQLRRQKQRWEADKAKMDYLLEFEGIMSAKMPIIQSEIATRRYQMQLMVETLRMVGSKSCKCKFFVDKLFNRLGTQ